MLSKVIKKTYCRLLSQDDSNGWHLHLHNVALQRIKRGQKGDVCTDVVPRLR